MSEKQVVLCNLCMGAQVTQETVSEDNGQTITTLEPCSRCEGWGYVAVRPDYLPVYSPFEKIVADE